MRTLNYTSIVLIEDFRISNNIAVEIRPYFCIVKLCHLFIYEKTKLLSIFSLLKALLQVPLYVIYVCAYVIYMYDILPQTVTYFPFYFSVWALLLFFKKLTWYISMNLTHHFWNRSLICVTFTKTTVFIPCVFPSASCIPSSSLKLRFGINVCQTNHDYRKTVES